MKILLINKFHYNNGGSETYYFAQAEALRKKGHEVIFFSMQDDRNFPCDQEKYFVKNVDYNGKHGIFYQINAGLSLIYSREAKRKMEQLIRDEKPDIAHMGLVNRQITFSVVDALKKYNIPVVMTMHELIFTCPCYTMLDNDGNVCEKCVTQSKFNCVKKKCVKSSRAKSLLAYAEAKFLAKKKLYDKVDLYIAECKQYEGLMHKSKFTQSRIIQMTNFLPVDQEYGFDSDYGDYILYFGRFSREKGLLTLLKAHEELKCKYPLKIVGKGPYQPDMEAYIKNNKLTNVEMPGAIYGDEMERIIQKAKIIIVPSEWYENCPYSLLQAIAKGKVVIASKIGGLPELIDDGKTGFLFEAGNSRELAEKIDFAMTMESREYENMSETIAEEAKKHHHWEKYTDTLIKEYTDLIEKYSIKG